MPLTHAAVSVVAVSGLELGAGLAMGLGTVAAGLAVTTLAGYVLVRLPDDYLVEPAGPLPQTEHQRWRQLAVKSGRNLLGGALIATGTVLAVPQVPPGKSLMLIGAMVLDFASKRRLERRFLDHSRSLELANRFRAYFGRAPLRLA